MKYLPYILVPLTTMLFITTAILVKVGQRKPDVELNFSPISGAELTEADLIEPEIIMPQATPAPITSPTNENTIAEIEKATEEISKLRQEITSMKASIPEKPEVEMLPDSPAVVLPDTLAVFFGIESSSLTTEAVQAIQIAAQTLHNEDRLRIQLRGHSDKSGAAEINAMLSRARAEVVKDKLLELGTAETLIEVIPFGESLSQDDENTHARRVELIFKARR